MPFRTPLSGITRFSDEELESSLRDCERVIRQQRADLEVYELCRAVRMELKRREVEKAMMPARQSANRARLA